MRQPRSGLVKMGGHVLFAFVVAGLCALLVWGVVPEVLDGQLIESDNYMRLVRVNHLVETGDWYDNSIPRSNAPYGEVLHWTRALDVLVLGGTLPFLAFFSFPEALHLSGVLLPPLFLILICYAVGWACVPLAGERFRFYGMITLLAQPGVVSYGLPGRVDHHALMFLLFAIALGLVIRWVSTPSERWSSAWAGAVLGLGLWVGPEFLLPIVLVLGTGAAIWAMDGPVDAKGSQRFTTGLLVLVAGAWLLEHPPARLLAEEYDRISAPHVLFAILAVGFWMAVARIEGVGMPRPREPMTATRKGIIALLGTAVAGGIMFLIYPSFFLGPTADIDPRLWSVWLDLIEERQAWLPPRTSGEIGSLVAHLGALAFCLPFVAWILLRGSVASQRWSWAFLAIALSTYATLSLVMARHVPYAEICIVLVTVAFLSRIATKLDFIRSPTLRSGSRAGVAAALITGPLFLGLGITAVGGETTIEVREASRAAAERCPTSSLLPFLSAEKSLGDQELTIAAHLDYGPEILYRTPHRVLGTPFHRNADGILAGFSILGGTDLLDVRGLIATRGVDLVLVCPIQSSIYGSGATAEEGGPSLHDLILSGQQPDWLERVELPVEVTGAFRVYRVKLVRVPGASL